MSTPTIRPAVVEDAAVIARHRVSMFRDIGNLPSEAMGEALFEASVPVLAEALRDGSYMGWLAVDAGGRVVAGVGVHLKPHLPRVTPERPYVVSMLIPLVVNVYTEPAWRRQGLARALMREIMTWAAERSYDRVVLHAAPDGRSLYASLGFVPTNEMRWDPALMLPTE